MCVHMCSVLVCVCVYGNPVGQMGIDVVNQGELTCCRGSDELFSPSLSRLLQIPTRWVTANTASKHLNTEGAGNKRGREEMSLTSHGSKSNK